MNFNQPWLRLTEAFEEILPRNGFYQRRLGGRHTCASLEEYRALPFLTKQDLVADARANPPFGSILTYPVERYTRYHQTSGTKGEPLRILDTPESWDWWGRCWVEVFRLAGVTAEDRLFFAFSFAPSIGFWAAYHGASMLGAMCIPAGGASSAQRLRMLLDTGATVLLCTPSYALHLAAVAQKEGIRLADSKIRVTVHAGEPGASIPSTRARLEEAWHARAIDHAGATEMGAWGLGCPRGHGVHVNENEFIAEVLEPNSSRTVAEGTEGELVLSNLGRAAWPAIRYRTGDLVRPASRSCPCGCPFLLFAGGILGRVDDMVTIRGMNVYPSGVEEVVRSVTAFAEFRIVVARHGELDELIVEIEETSSACDQVADRLRGQLGIRVPVKAVPEGTLPRSEGKARRMVNLRGSI